MALPLGYNLRNLMVRRLSASLTFSVVTTVVAVMCVLLSFAAGIHASLAASGAARNVVVLQTGATAESTSIINPEETGRLVQAPHVAKGVDGRPLISPELCTQTSVPRKAGGTPANVAVRGVDAVAFDVHPEVRLVEGRVFADGAREVIVGVQARDRFQGLNVGGEVTLGNTQHRTFTVVGVFEAAGGALECEIWGGRSAVSDAYSRRFVSSAFLRLEDEGYAAETIRYVKGASVRMNAKTEVEYYRDLTTKTREIVVLTMILIAIMGVGAVFAVANTMYAAVDGRRREIAMLRTLGFSRAAIVSSFLIESLLITGAACAAGIAVSLFFSGSRQDFLSDTTWTVLTYELRMTPRIVGAAVGVALAVGLGGGLAPALRASRVRIIEALRKA